MFRYIMILGFITAAALSMVHAQEVPPNPLRAEEIVVPYNVDVVETLPLWWIDNGALHLYNETSSEWQTFALPVTPDDMPGLVRDADGSYTVTLCHPSTSTQYYGSNNCVWHFDPTTGEFTLMEVVCGGLMPGQGDWVTYVSPETGESYFCNIQTGELSAPLPIDLEVLNTTGVPFTTFTVPISTGTNPSGHLMVISFYGVFETFNLETGALIPLRPIEGTVSLNTGVAWIDDTHILFIALDNYYTFPQQFRLYSADVTQDNSAQLLHTGEAQELPTLYLNPDAYEWLESDCTFHELSFDTLEMTSYTIPGICTRGVQLDDGSGDWVAVQDHRVLRYNPETRVVQMLFMDGICSYDHTPSPASRYLNLMFASTTGCDELAVLDLNGGGIVYQTHFAFEDGRVRWVNEDTLLFYEMANGEDHLVHPSTSEEISLPHVLSEVGGIYDPFSQDGRWIMAQSEDGAVVAYDTIMNWDTAITSALTGYAVTVRSEADNIIHLSIKNAEGIPVGDWRVRNMYAQVPPYRTEENQISIYNVDTSEWQSYPYPFESDDPIYPYPNSDGTLRMQICFLMGYQRTFQPASCYSDFNPITGDFITPASVCGEYLPHDWGRIWISIGGVFCEISTGEVSAQIPSDLHIISEEGADYSPVFPRTVAYANPANEWLIFSEGYSDPTFYAFQVHTGELNELGQIVGGAFNCFDSGSCRWTDDTHLNFSTSGVTYSVDVTQAGSLQASG